MNPSLPFLAEAGTGHAMPPELTVQQPFASIPELTRALRSGQEAAYVWLLHRWGGRLDRYALALAAGDEALGREIGQAVWLRIMRHMRPLPDEAALWNWLAQAARHAACDLRRSRGRYRRALERFTDWLRQRPADEEPEDALLLALDRALERLDPDERALIEGRYFTRLNLEEIGAGQGLGTRAVEGRLARLRQKLRTLIAEELSRPNPL